ncbi:MAG: hypothetical protein ABIN80_23505 [Dyadobacter sp.]
MTINNGTIVAKTADDCLNAGTFIYINGGIFMLTALPMMQLTRMEKSL